MGLIEVQVSKIIKGRYYWPKIAELLEADSEGQARVPSINIHIIFLTILDISFRFVFTELVVKKIDVTRIVVNYARWYERQSRKSVRSFHTDNGTEFWRLLDLIAQEGVENPEE